MLQGLSLVLVQRKEKTMLVAFGGKGSELSNQVLAFLSAENYIPLKTASSIYSAIFRVYWVVLFKRKQVLKRVVS